MWQVGRQKREKRPVMKKGIIREEDFGFSLESDRKDSVSRELCTPVISLMRYGGAQERKTHQMEEGEGKEGKTTQGKAPMGSAQESRSFPPWKDLVSVSLTAGQVHPHPFWHHWEAGLCRY